MGVDETLRNEIVRRVLSVARPDKIILFGSAAAGQMTKDSDVDLLVVEPGLANAHEKERGDSWRAGRHRIPGGRHRDADRTLRANEAGHRRNCVPGQQVWPNHL